MTNQQDNDEHNENETRAKKKKKKLTHRNTITIINEKIKNVIYFVATCTWKIKKFKYKTNVIHSIRCSQRHGMQENVKCNQRNEVTEMELEPAEDSL